MRLPAVLALLCLSACAQAPPPSLGELQGDATRVVKLGDHIKTLYDAQRRVMARYAVEADAYRPGIAEDLRAALADRRYSAYTAQLDIVHEFVIVQDKLSSDMRFNGQPKVIALQSEMAGLAETIPGAQHEYNFSVTILMQKVKALNASEKAAAERAGILDVSKVSWYSDYNGAESARSAVVFDDDGD